MFRGVNGDPSVGKSDSVFRTAKLRGMGVGADSISERIWREAAAIGTPHEYAGP